MAVTRRSPVLLSIAFALLAGCTGGGNSTSPPTAPPPSLELLAGVPAQGDASAQRGDVDATGQAARFNGAAAVAVDNMGVVYVLDVGNRKIRKIAPAGAVTTLATFGASTILGGIAMDSSGNVVITRWEECPPGGSSPCAQNARIDRIAPTGEISPLLTAFGTQGDGTTFEVPGAIAYTRNGDLYVAASIVARASAGFLEKLSPNGTLTRVTNFGPASAIAVDDAGNVFFYSGFYVWKMDSGGSTTVLSERLGGFSGGIALDTAGNLYVSDSADQVIRKITPSGTVTIIAGTQGMAGFTGGALPGLLSRPLGLALHGRDLYIAMDTAVAVIRNVP